MLKSNQNVTGSAQPEPAIDVECLHHYFEYYVDKYPDRPAIIGTYDTYTYEEVELKSNALARYIRVRGAKPGTFVGIYFNRSELPILATLAILKSGACYIPLDPAYPKERIEHIVNDCGISIILTEDALIDALGADLPCVNIAIDREDEKISHSGTHRIPPDESGVVHSDLCYIIYTSGSTGKPKGILTEHGNVVAFTNSFRKICKLTFEDRVYQGFSMGFDGSIEEIWQCFSSGATLVTSTNDSAKLASEAAKIIDRHGVTFFSTVPTFLSMIEEELPSVRLLIVSGEPCRKELVDKWATEGCTMLNVYGPTETTVNTTSELCVPGKEITIGKPLEGYDIYILDEQLKPVPQGEKGELYIGGAGVARGYHMQEELTAKHFVDNPFKTGKQKMYRTGDRISMNSDGELLFHGRIDNQVKVRGYRIELSEIENVLLDFEGIQSSAVVVVEKGGMKHISAFATPLDGEIDRDELLDFCSDRLPSYMIPSFFTELSEMPKTASGKIDRKSLPELFTPFVKQSRDIVAAKSDEEKLLLKIWKDIFQLEKISVTDNFFTDLGGYSLLAAEMASRVRKDHEIDLPIRSIYACPTIEELATCVKIKRPSENSFNPMQREGDKVEPAHSVTRFLVQTLQAFSLVGIWGLRATPVALLFYLWLPVMVGAEVIGTTLLVTTGAITLGWWPLMIVFSIVSKWILIGRFREGKYPLWGWYFFRFWLVQRLQEMAGVSHFAGTPVLSLYFRLLGAKIGKGVILDTDALVAHDLITINDESAVASESQLLGYSVESGAIIFDRITVGKRCFVGIHSTLAPGSSMEDYSKLGDLSLLEKGAIAKAATFYQGSPAVESHFELPEISENKSQKRHGFLWGVIHFVAAELLSLVTWCSNIPSALLLWAAFSTGNLYYIGGALLLSVPISIISYCLIVPALKVVILPKTKPGSYAVESLLYLRKWLVDNLMRTSRTYMHAIYTTIYLAPWLRMMGAKIGNMAEISTVSQVTPDLIHIEDESFFADGSMIGGRHFYRGHMRCGINRIKRRSFVGNNAILPMGHTLGENCLLGVLSYPPANGVVPDDSEWLGSPSFKLPHRVKVEGFADEEIFSPTKKLFLQRYIIDGLRILLPGYITLFSGTLFFLLLYVTVHSFTMLTSMALVPITTLLTTCFALLSVVAIKWIVMRQIQPEVKPLWCTYIWWNELVNGVHETIASPIVSSLGGTPFINWYFRMLGAKIGKGVYMETTLFSEFDLVHIGNNAVLNQGVVIQNHLFEDRIFKSSTVDIKDGVTLGNMSIVLYDAVVDSQSIIDPLSLVMKGESIPGQSRWSGIPVVRK